MQVFPLLVDQQYGCLYIHFQNEHQFTTNEIGWVKLLAHRAVDAIRHATTYIQMHDRARQLATLHSVAQSLVGTPHKKNLLRLIAWNTLNILAADVVSIYEYLQSSDQPIERQFQTPPSLAGKLIHENQMTTEIRRNDSPALLVRRDKNLFEEHAENNPDLYDPNRQRDYKRHPMFVEREKIKSCAGLLLKEGNETVGVMFINYRRHHHFPPEEIRLIEILASSVAIAIKRRRFLEKLQIDLMSVTHQLESPLTAIIGFLSSESLNSLPDNSCDDVKNARAFAEDAVTLCHGSFRTFAREAGRQVSIEIASIDVRSEMQQSMP